MTFEKAVDSIKSKFVNADASGVDDFAVQITLTDEDCGGTLYAEVKNGVLNIEPYDYHDNNAAITISKAAFLGYLGKRTSLDRALTDDGAYVTGDTTKVENLRKLVSFEKRSYTRKGAATEKQEPIKAVNTGEAKKIAKKAAPKTKSARKPRETRKTQK